MTVEVIATWKNDDLELISRFEIDNDVFQQVEETNDDNLIKDFSIGYLRLHYKIDPEIFGMQFLEWDFSEY